MAVFPGRPGGRWPHAPLLLLLLGLACGQAPSRYLAGVPIFGVESLDETSNHQEDWLLELPEGYSDEQMDALSRTAPGRSRIISSGMPSKGGLAVAALHGTVAELEKFLKLHPEVRCAERNQMEQAEEESKAFLAPRPVPTPAPVEDLDDEAINPVAGQGSEHVEASPPSSLTLLVTGCDGKETIDGLPFNFLGTTASGAPYYQGLNSWYIYYDPDCNGADPATPRWILDTDAPSLTADKDLDGDGKCSYKARFSSSSSNLPSGVQSWSMLCPSSWSTAQVELTTEPASWVSWGLDRIDQRGLPINKAYKGSQTSGSGVHIYIMDTGVRTTHEDFAGRAVPTLEYIGSRNVCDPADSTCANDMNGHGTHVAGISGGTMYGVAKDSILHACKIFDDAGAGQTLWTVMGVTMVLEALQKPAVMSMSLSSAGTSSMKQMAVERSIEAGVSVIVSAGNQATDACERSPANVAIAVTVAATDIRDTRADYSNYGSCVDIFAPGSEILSASHQSDTLGTEKSGTSMACPFVSGVVAWMLGQEPNLSPAEITQRLLSTATADVVTDPNGSPNLLVFQDIPDTVPTVTSTTSSTSITSTATTATTTTTMTTLTSTTQTVTLTSTSTTSASTTSSTSSTTATTTSATSITSTQTSSTTTEAAKTETVTTRTATRTSTTSTGSTTTTELRAPVSGTSTTATPSTTTATTTALVLVINVSAVVTSTSSSSSSSTTSSSTPSTTTSSDSSDRVPPDAGGRPVTTGTSTTSSRSTTSSSTVSTGTTTATTSTVSATTLTTVTAVADSSAAEVTESVVEGAVGNILGNGLADGEAVSVATPLGTITVVSLDGVASSKDVVVLEGDSGPKVAASATMLEALPAGAVMTMLGIQGAKSNDTGSLEGFAGVQGGNLVSPVVDISVCTIDGCDPVTLVEPLLFRFPDAPGGAMRSGNEECAYVSKSATGELQWSTDGVARATPAQLLAAGQDPNDGIWCATTHLSIFGVTAPTTSSTLTTTVVEETASPGTGTPESAEGAADSTDKNLLSEILSNLTDWSTTPSPSPQADDTTPPWQGSGAWPGDDSGDFMPEEIQELLLGAAEPSARLGLASLPLCLPLLLHFIL